MSTVRSLHIQCSTSLPSNPPLDHFKSNAPHLPIFNAIANNYSLKSSIYIFNYSLKSFNIFNEHHKHTYNQDHSLFVFLSQDISMLASSNFNSTKSIVYPLNSFKLKHGRNSQPTCSNPFIFLLLFYDTQATSHSIIEIGVLGII